ncbi:MAG TPA: FadR/GntR family transcriptional regulator [Clostridia bacterium]|nr:FadR/GntR family transcriptional regulator [Clostridia bacterium]
MSKRFHIKNKTKCDIVVDEIKNSIIRGEYKQGEKLPPEMALCAKYGVSRITIRESLKMLSMMGIVSIRQGIGTTVENVDLALFLKPMYQLIEFENVDINAIYDARLYVETGACRLAAKNRTQDQLSNLHEILVHFQQCVEHEDITQGVLVDTEFHVAIAEASGNELIEAMLLTLEDISNACVRRRGGMTMFMDVAYEHHKNIYEAIKAKDLDAAEKWISIHTIGSKKFLNQVGSAVNLGR